MIGKIKFNLLALIFIILILTFYILKFDNKSNTRILYDFELPTINDHVLMKIDVIEKILRSEILKLNLDHFKLFRTYPHKTGTKWHSFWTLEVIDDKIPSKVVEDKLNYLIEQENNRFEDQSSFNKNINEYLVNMYYEGDIKNQLLFINGQKLYLIFLEVEHDLINKNYSEEKIITTKKIDDIIKKSNNLDELIENFSQINKLDLDLDLDYKFKNFDFKKGKLLNVYNEIINTNLHKFISVLLFILSIILLLFYLQYSINKIKNNC